MATKLSRRQFLKVAAAGAGSMGAAALLAACGGAAPSGGQAQPGAPVQGDTVVTEITFWWWDQVGEVWKEPFEKAHPNIKLNFVNTPFADAHDKLLTSFAAGSGAPDVASIEISRVGNFTAKGGLSDLLAPPFDAGSLKNG